MEVSNADRVVFPDSDITKGDVVDYYQQVAGSMLPYLQGRALTVERYPKGIGGEGFMQKNAPDHYPDSISRHRVPKEGGGTTVYPVIHDMDAIGFFANQGVITFHIPPVRVDDVDRPDWVIWDLDPPAGGLDAVRQAAVTLRSLLEEHAIETHPMTSGSKGYHLRARLQPELDAGAVAGVARGLAALGAERHPDLLTVEFHKKNRGDRVFVDWLRNAPYATAVAPWSLRARDEAPVAAPLTWDEVEEVAPDGLRLGDVGARLKGDPWKNMVAVDISAAVGTVAEALAESGIVLGPFDRFRP
jgi:bifunctional non-homologous end joining protein LigD